MDRISYKCAKAINDDFAWYTLYICKNVKIYRDGNYLDDMYSDDNPDDRYDDTIIAPDWNDLRKCLYSLSPSWYILSEFEAIDNIDDYAYKLVDYYKSVASCK